jgi:soluble lytic murein transglycosylase-like protein
MSFRGQARGLARIRVRLCRLVCGLVLALSVRVMGSDLAVLHNGFSIRHDRREVVGTVTRLYVSPPATGYVDVPTEQIDHFEPDLTPHLAPLAPAAVKSSGLDQVVASAGERHHLDPDLIRSVIHAESGFNVRAVSPKGAQGLMQLMPGTASGMGVANAFDPQSNVEGGTQYLRMLLERYDFDLIKALAAYNAGPQRVEHYGGVPPFHETQAYVARIIREFNQKKLAEQKAAAKAARSQPRDSTKSTPPPANLLASP